MSSIDTDEFKRLLLEERSRLMVSSNRLEADVREGTNDFSGDLSVSGEENHLGDNASDTYERELDEGGPALVATAPTEEACASHGTRGSMRMMVWSVKVNVLRQILKMFRCVTFTYTPM